jgi:hypothetical protein
LAPPFCGWRVRAADGIVRVSPEIAQRLQTLELGGDGRKKVFLGVAVRPDSCPTSTDRVHLNIRRPGLLCADLSNLPARRRRGTGTGQVGSRLGRRLDARVPQGRSAFDSAAKAEVKKDARKRVRSVRKGALLELAQEDVGDLARYWGKREGAVGAPAGWSCKGPLRQDVGDGSTLRGGTGLQ